MVAVLVRILVLMPMLAGKSSGGYGDRFRADHAPLPGLLLHLIPRFVARAERHFHGLLARLLHDHAVKLKIILREEDFGISPGGFILFLMGNFQPESVF